MSELLLHNAKVIFDDRVERGGLIVKDGRVAHVFAGRPPQGISVKQSIDLREMFVAPGMIDIHIHGSAGVDVQDADQSALAKLSEFLLREGVTGYFATFVPTDEKGYRSALAEIKAYTQHQDGSSSSPRGARILGVHFEGPFVNHNRCGALKREHFRTFDGDPRSASLFTNADADDFQPSCARVMTLAPEVAGGLELVRELVRNNVSVFIGHTQAEPATLNAAIEAGARHITHFPNALDPIHHRSPGAALWALVRSEVTMDCIADFQHVHPLMLQLIYKTKSANKVALISDAIQPTGMGDGEFTVWGEKIAVRDGKTSLTEGPAAGTIAGSVISLREALRNIVGIGVPVYEAASMASIVPARAAQIDHEHGSLAEGKRADIIAMDEDFNIRLAIVGGSIALDKR